MSTAILRCSLGDLPILSGSLRLPALGPWYAAVDVHAPSPTAAVTGPASLRFTREGGGVDVFEGTVLQAELDPGALSLAIVVVGGAGKLDTPIGPRDHAAGLAEIPVGLIAKGIAADAGELLEDGIEAALDARLVRRWTRFGGTARQALDLLTVLLGFTWRLTPAGKLWIGVDAFPAGGAAPRVGFELGDGAVQVAPDGAPMLPGTTVTALGKTPIEVRALEVLYQIAPGKLRASVRAAVPGDPPRAPVLERYRASYAARVVAQDAAGLLELAVDAPEVGTLRAVPFRLGIPGCKVTLPASTRVRVRFEGADPRGAYACDVDQDPTPTHALALVGDACGYLSGTSAPGGGPVMLSWSATATGAPGEAPISVVGPGHKLIKGITGP